MDEPLCLAGEGDRTGAGEIRLPTESTDGRCPFDWLGCRGCASSSSGTRCTTSSVNLKFDGELGNVVAQGVTHHTDRQAVYVPRFDAATQYPPVNADRNVNSQESRGPAAKERTDLL